MESVQRRAKGRSAPFRSLHFTLPLIISHGRIYSGKARRAGEMPRREASSMNVGASTNFPNSNLPRTSTNSLRGGGVKKSAAYRSAVSSVHSMGLPRAPQSSQVQLNAATYQPNHAPRKQQQQQQSGGNMPGIPLPLRQNNAAGQSNFNMGLLTTSGKSLPLTDLYPTRANHSAFKSTTYIRDIALPAVPAVRAGNIELRSCTMRHVTMAKERYLPVAAPPAHGVADDSFVQGLLTVAPLGVDSQVDERLTARMNDLEKAKWLKRTSEFLPHRIPLGYNMSGCHKQLHQRYQITSDDMRRLEELKASERLLYGHGIKGNFKRKAAVPKFKKPEGEASGNVAVEVKSPSPAGDSRSQSRTGNLNSRTGGTTGDVVTGSITSGAGTGGHGGEGDDVFPDAGGGKDGRDSSAADGAPRGPGLKLASAGDGSAMLQDMSGLVRKESFNDDEDIFAHMESYISDKHRQIFTERFNKMDAKGSGKISMSDLQRTLSSGNSENARYVMEVFDLDRNGYIDMEEFVAVAALNDRLSNVLNGKGATDPLELNLQALAYHIGKFKALFQLVDDSGDGKVETSEVLILIAAAFGIMALDEQLAKRITARIDTDKSGFIEFVEFMQYIPFFLKLQRKVVKDPLGLDLVANAKKGLERRRSTKKNITSGHTERKASQWGSDSG
eukprot:scpid42223/ scgid31031/ Probable calcium-binding protein CML23; Calmodulin-like protein 23